MTAIVVGVIGLSGNAQAKEYPGDRPITVVVPFAAGGPTDKVAREVSVVMSKYLKTSMVVENLGGAGGTIGARKVAQSPADGYTVLVYHIGMATAPALYRKLGFDPLRDFEMLGEIADVPMVLVGTRNLPPANLKDLLGYINANAANLSLANAGVGSASHLCGLLLQDSIHTTLTTVPYKGSAPALSDLMGGQVSLMCDQTTSLAGLLQANSLKPYAAMQSRRVEAFKNIPTSAEQGLIMDVRNWHGMYAPKGTPKPVIDKLVSALQSAVSDPDFRARMNALGAEAVSARRASPESLRAVLTSEIGKWGPVIKKAGIYAD
ncbi:MULTISPECIES: tripartite tricarboxylate transporter substrate-binding protein [unclassified Cupriavidus]|uniref:tripartite tricarboxylate transporter substrate-binding protein n=1 Tax=unclassified Cupriavidus TaxID=2640874 RepID=UPI003F928046